MTHTKLDRICDVMLIHRPFPELHVCVKIGFGKRERSESKRAYLGQFQSKRETEKCPLIIAALFSTFEVNRLSEVFYEVCRLKFMLEVWNGKMRNEKRKKELNLWLLCFYDCHWKLLFNIVCIVLEIKSRERRNFWKLLDECGVKLEGDLNQ